MVSKVDAYSSSDDELSDCKSICEINSDDESEPVFQLERRYAVIFGNNGYRRRPLRSCHKDAKDLANVLQKFGFICTVVLDTTKKHMEIVIDEICKQIKKDDCLLVFFAGHGKEEKGENYLMSIESDQNSNEHNSTTLNSLIEKLNRCENAVNLIIIDACRADQNNRTFRCRAIESSIEDEPTSIIDRRKVKASLALILSCDPGLYAFDGRNEECNSPFMNIFLKELSKKDLTLDALMRRVTNEMIKLTNNRSEEQQQRPWFTSCLPKIFDFNSGFNEQFMRTSQLDFNQIKYLTKQIDVNCDSQIMAGNHKYFLYCPKDHLCLVDYQGKQRSIVKRTFSIQDICWSSYKKRFLILTTDNCIYSYNYQTNQYRLYKKFQFETYRLTCHENRLMISTINHLYEYDLNTRKYVKRFDMTQSMMKIQFDLTGNYFGVILREKTSTNYRLQLLYSADMTILRDISIGEDPTNLLALPNQQFLISFINENKFSLFDLNDLSRKEILYEINVRSMAFLTNKNRLVIQTNKPETIRFHHLIN